MYKFTSSNGSITKQHKIGKTMQAVLWCNVTEVSVEKWLIITSSAGLVLN